VEIIGDDEEATVFDDEEVEDVDDDVEPVEGVSKKGTRVYHGTGAILLPTPAGVTVVCAARCSSIDDGGDIIGDLGESPSEPR